MSPATCAMSARNQRADLVGDRAKPRPVDDARVRRESRDDELRSVLASERADLLVVELARRRRHVVRHDVVQRAREIFGGTVRAMPAVRRTHAEQRVAGREQRQVRREIRLRARVRLHVRVARAEEPLRAFDREPLRDVGELAARVVALAGIAVGVLVREQRALRREHARAHVVLGRDELEVSSPDARAHPRARARAPGRDRLGVRASNIRPPALRRRASRPSRDSCGCNRRRPCRARGRRRTGLRARRADARRAHGPRP